MVMLIVERFTKTKTINKGMQRNVPLKSFKKFLYMTEMWHIFYRADEDMTRDEFDLQIEEFNPIGSVDKPIKKAFWKFLDMILKSQEPIKDKHPHFLYLDTIEKRRWFWDGVCGFFLSEQFGFAIKDKKIYNAHYSEKRKKIVAGSIFFDADPYFDENKYPLPTEHLTQKEIKEKAVYLLLQEKDTLGLE